MVNRPLLLLITIGCVATVVLGVVAVVGERASWFASPAVANHVPTIWKLRANGKVIKAEVVTSEADVTRGLGGRDPLAADEGMLFVFAKPGPYAFWMKGMRFPIDIIWLDHGRVVDMAENMQPPTSPLDWPQTYQPKASADMVLEVDAGQADAYGLTIGAEIDINR